MAGPPAQVNTFIGPPKGAGRSAPTLLEDLTAYDPRRQSQPGRNLLRDSPLNFTHGDLLGSQLPSGCCDHDFWLKQRQSRIPQLDERPGPDTIWILAAMCRSCHLHVQLKVDYSVHHGNYPCPNTERPLHHLVRSEWRESLERADWEDVAPGQPAEIYLYECSGWGCSAIVSIRLTPPEIHDSVMHTLTDTALLRARTDAAFRHNETNTQGMRYPLSIDVLNDLRIYIRNAWDEDPEHKTIKLSNRRFMVRFGPRGEPCKDVLEGIGFRFDDEGDCWHVPTPKLEESLPLKDLNNVFLDNVEQELLSLIISRPQEEHSHVQDLPRPAPALREFQRALGCQDYDKHPASRTLDPDPDLRPRTYTGLGIPRAAADSLVSHFYHRQVESDPENGPSYLQFLKIISQDRQSEALQTEVVLEESRGCYDLDTLVEAYRYFGLTLEDATDDDHIIGIFSSRLDDMRSHEQQMRLYLRIIGLHRNSRGIIDFADNILNTPEQALQYLGADASCTDEGLQAIYAVKVDENKEQAQKAIHILAKHRKSILLENWVEAAFAQDVPMDAAQGYHALNINDRTVEDDMILSAYDVAIMDNPGSQEYFTKALTAIQQDRGSTMLRDRVQRNAPQLWQAPLDEPVGLENIGNTCYLNSLLQFLFTMVELRRIVLNFDEFKMDPSDANVLQKKVGQRNITKREVQTAQNFVASLSGLFKGMIQTPQSAIRPEKELAKLTLETDNAKEKIRRRSTLAGERPNLGHIDSQPILGPLQLPRPQVNGVMNDMARQSLREPTPAAESLDQAMQDVSEDKVNTTNMPELVDVDDNSSEATLVSRSGSTGTPILELPSAEDQQALLDNKENLSPTKESPKHGDPEADHPAPLAPSSPSKVNAQAGALSQQEKDVAQPPPPMIYARPPGKPPPVPPRKSIEPTTDILEEYARQQDVTEVLSHCLFQFSCAMRPTGIDKTGEQQDEVHDMFFGQNISHTVPEKEPATAIQFFSVITRVANEPADVYAALDTEYDLSLREGGSKAFVSMSKLPPVFSIALDRVAWDKQANRPAKLNNHVDVPQRIFLDRYMEAPPDSDLFRRREQTWELKKELATLTERRKILETSHASSADLPALFEEARIALESLQSSFAAYDDPYAGSLNINPDTISTMALMADDLRAELDAIKNRITLLCSQIKESFADTSMTNHPYRLHAAFFHRGGAAGGHYWVYIYDHKKEVWRKYNDDRVSIVDNLNEIFGAPDPGNVWASPNPYFLVYVKEQEIEKIVETVKRDVVFPAPDGPPPQLPTRDSSCIGMSQMDHMPPTAHAVNGYNRGQDGTYDVEMTNYGQEQREFQEMKQSKPQAYKSQYLSEIKGVEYGAPTGINKQGNWDDSNADVGRLRQW